MHREGGGAIEARPCEAGGTEKEAWPLGKEARCRPEAGCRKQGQGVRTQDQLPTQPLPEIQPPVLFPGGGLMTQMTCRLWVHADEDQTPGVREFIQTDVEQPRPTQSIRWGIVVSVGREAKPKGGHMDLPLLPEDLAEDSRRLGGSNSRCLPLGPASGLSIHVEHPRVFTHSGHSQSCRGLRGFGWRRSLCTALRCCGVAGLYREGAPDPPQMVLLIGFVDRVARTEQRNTASRWAEEAEEEEEGEEEEQVHMSKISCERDAH
ncbi:hypothetical protein EYF80_033115 [Liparis tanakae]|uniref:Uncharacterized protein n=1 Tax=Liparis tanakae TaxID=230148 RepID=A0A4Z2GSP8_9TELE|nr:hypothetical protein EYF80_033115 [Liparis tanakae]